MFEFKAPEKPATPVAKPANPANPQLAEARISNFSNFSKQPSPDLRASLTALVNRIADHGSFSEADRAEALAIALKSPAESLELYRRLVGEIKDAPPVEECGKCQHIDMRHEAGLNGVRRFWWACGKGHAPLVCWTASERVLTRPNDCFDYARATT